nr:hypothetical protein CFP56_06316 [Quercus suber]
MRANGNPKGNSEKPKTQNNWGFDEERSGKSSGHSTPATATYSNPSSSLRSGAEIQNDSQIDKGVMPNVADGLEGTASQSTENQGCNPTVPRSESSSRDMQRMNALEGNISDELSLVGLSNSAPHEAQEISSPLKPLPEKTISLHDKKISRKEIENLLEGVVSYTSICCGGGGGDCEVVGVKEEDESLTVSGFSDVLGVWTVDNCGDRDELRVFFPVVSEEVRNGIRVGCGVGYLAGVVMCEAFLLRLCLKFGSGNSRLELEKDLHNWAIQTINGFRSFWFIDTLLKMLLEPVLPVTSLLSYEDGVLLQEVLNDVVIRVEYSFLEPSRVIQLAGKHLKNLILKWLFVADTAIRSAREKGNQAKAFSYINAFSESCLPSQLIKWVTDQTVTGGKISKPNISTPVALLAMVQHLL